MISLVQDLEFMSAIEGMETQVFSDIDAAYDWVCDFCSIKTFVADGPAWDLFYDMWEECNK